MTENSKGIEELEKRGGRGRREGERVGDGFSLIPHSSSSTSLHPLHPHSSVGI